VFSIIRTCQEHTQAEIEVEIIKQIIHLIFLSPLWAVRALGLWSVMGWLLHFGSPSALKAHMPSCYLSLLTPSA
jgi:hypothetical protein